MAKNYYTYQMNLKRKKICRIAVLDDWYALKYVPEKLKTIKLCNIAVQKSINAFRYVTAEYKLTDLYEKAKLHYGNEFKNMSC
jgi:hypothetical protein